MPQNAHVKLAHACCAEIAHCALHPLHARPPAANLSQKEAGTRTLSSRNGIDPELAGFCERFNLEPQVQDFDHGEIDDTCGSGDLDSDNELSEIVEQSELDHFSEVLHPVQKGERAVKKMTHSEAIQRELTKNDIPTQFLNLQRQSGARKSSAGAMDSQEEEEEEDSPDIQHSAMAPNATAPKARANNAVAPNKMVSILTPT
ncbi:hypothetical protein EI94DRAFT_1698082 [Lactarius quietus]|nr:hypothetical protein EI94DRAFT_1698082 [Lactarius quietus]